MEARGWKALAEPSHGLRCGRRGAQGSVSGCEPALSMQGRQTQRARRGAGTQGAQPRRGRGGDPATWAPGGRGPDARGEARPGGAGWAGAEVPPTPPTNSRGEGAERPRGEAQLGSDRGGAGRGRRSQGARAQGVREESGAFGAGSLLAGGLRVTPECSGAGAAFECVCVKVQLFILAGRGRDSV